MTTLINIAAYQLAWFACVLGAANQLAWLGTAIAVLLVGWHVLRAEDRGTQLRLLAVALVLGLFVDSVLVSSGAVQFSTGMFNDYLAPHWMLALWLAFATTLTVSLNWLMTKPLWSIVFGAAGGPLAYYGGMKLGAMNIPSLLDGLLLIGALWALAMGVLSAALVKLVPNPAAEPVA
jgi:hypothetical protein